MDEDAATVTYLRELAEVEISPVHLQRLSERTHDGCR